MLERTASGLEPSRLKLLLPRVAGPGAKPSRAFHATALCQNASSTEPTTGSLSSLSPASSAQLHAGFFEGFSPELVKAQPLVASVFLLDFLYPKGALAAMQKASLRVASRHGALPIPARALPQAHAHGRPNLQYTSRFYSQSTAAPSNTPSEPASSSLSAQKQPSFSASEGSIRSPVAEEAAVRGELDRLLHVDPMDRGLDAYDRVWDLYRRIGDMAAQKEYDLAVLLYLAPSRRHADATRILHLYGQVDASQRDTAVTAGAIAAYVIAGDTATALELFRHSATTEVWSNAAPPGIDALMAYALKNSDWDYIAEVWSIYREKSELKKISSALLGAVAELHNLRGRLLALHAHVTEYAQQMGTVAEGDEPDPYLVILEEVYKAVLEVSIDHVDPVHTYPMVSAMKNPRVFENFLRATLKKGDNQFAAQAFSEYRQMVNYRPRVNTLVSMVRVFYPSNVRGMEDVLKDWHNLKGKMNRWGYQKYLAFYASRGDLNAVYRMWNEFTKLYPDSIYKGEDTFSHLLRVHAVRGDLARVEQVFSEITSKYNRLPNTSAWNIRLHIYVERGKYSEAMKIFQDLCGAVEPDDYSFSTIMAMVGGRGDLGLVSDLYWLAQQCGVKITESIVDPIVEAYCQNDRFDEAERLCVVTTRERKVHGAPYTGLWNTLIHQYALRHDLVAVNRILKLMTKLNVTYDADTYSGLLFALAQCRQPRRAVELLRAAQEEGIFRPTADHYTLLMMAYIRSKQPQRALQVNRLMHHMGFQRSSQQIQMVIKAFSHWQNFPKGVEADSEGVTSTERRELFAKALREFQRSLTEGSRSMRSQQSMGRDAVRMHLGAVRRFSFIIFMLVQARDFAGVEEVMQLYQSIAPADERDQPMPLKLCNALMLSDFYEGRYDLVKNMWETVLGRAKEIGRPQMLQETELESILGHTKNSPDGKPDNETESQLRRDLSATDAFGATPQEAQLSPDKKKAQHKIVAKLRYGLTDPLKTMQRVLATERNPDALIDLINRDILGNGFLLDSKNWNHYVQNLARLGRTREAFDVCETRLMGQWSGFTVLQPRGHEWQQTSAASSGNGNDFSGASSQSSSNMISASHGGRNGGGSNESTSAIAAAIAGGNSSSEEPRFNTTSTRLSRAQQLRESATRYNRPMTFTFMVLAKAYLELEQAAMWSSAAEREFKDLAVRYPGTVHAVRTMVRMNSRIEGRVFGSNDEFEGLPIF